MRLFDMPKPVVIEAGFPGSTTTLGSGPPTVRPTDALGAIEPKLGAGPSGFDVGAMGARDTSGYGADQNAAGGATPQPRPDELQEALRVAKEAVFNSQGNVHNAIAAMISHAVAPPSRPGIKFGTKDLLWAVPMVLSAFAGARRGSDFGSLAMGLAEGALGAKKDAADRDYQNQVDQANYRREMDKGQVDQAREIMQGALQHLNLLENEWYRRGMLQSKTDAETGRNNRAELGADTRLTVAGMQDATKRYGIDQTQGGSPMARSKIGLSDAQAKFIQGPKTRLTNEQADLAGWKGELARQSFKFHTRYDPQLVAKVTNEVQKILSDTKLDDKKRELLALQITNYPLDQHAKRAEIYSRIAERDRNGAGGMTDQEAATLFRMNQSALDDYDARRNDVLNQDPLTADEEQSYKALQQQQEQLRGHFASKMTKQGPGASGQVAGEVPELRPGVTAAVKAAKRVAAENAIRRAGGSADAAQKVKALFESKYGKW